MLPAAARLRTAADFTAAARRGRRGSSPTVVVHLLLTDRSADPRAGFVVSKKVGNSVVRHRVTRRLRPLVRTRLSQLPTGTDLVVRALPAAADATSARLSRHLDRALQEAARRAGAFPTAVSAGLRNASGSAPSMGGVDAPTRHGFRAGGAGGVDAGAAGSGADEGSA